MDSTVITRRGKQQGAVRGYNPNKLPVPDYLSPPEFNFQK